MKDKENIVKIIACILIAILLVLGTTIGLAYAARHARAVIKLGDITVDGSTVTYVASFYKMKYIEKHNHEGSGDSVKFWQSMTEEGITHEADFKQEFGEFMRLTVAKAYLYITLHGYTQDDKIAVAQKSDDVLREYANGSIAEFNHVAEAYGFDYNDFQNADALFYKSERADALFPSMMGEEEYERRLMEAYESVEFNDYYGKIDIIAVPIINDYYAR